MKKSNKVISFLLAALFVLTSFSVSAFADTSGVVFSFSCDEAVPGQELVVELKVSSASTEVDGLLLLDLVYDSTFLDFLGYESFGTLITGCMTGEAAYDAKTGYIQPGYSPAIVPNGTICKLRFLVSSEMQAGTETKVSMSAYASKNRKPVSDVVAPSCIVRTKSAGPVKDPTTKVTVSNGRLFSVTTGGEKRYYNTELTCDFPLNAPITIKAEDTADFAYWHSSSNLIVSRTPEYSFTASIPDTYTAVYNTKLDGKVLVIYESLFGQVMARAQLTADEAADFRVPDVPSRFGYSPVGWDCDNAALAEKITAALATETEADDVITILPTYILTASAKTITVHNGIGSGLFEAESVTTVVANPPETGKKFSHWIDGTGRILSYRSDYTFYVMADMDLTAVFVDENATVNARGVSEIISIGKNYTDRKLTFASYANVPDGFTILNAGVIATSNEAIGTDEANFTSDTATYVRGGAFDGTAGRFAWTKSSIGSETWYVRAFITYKNASGNTYTTYGDIVSADLAS